MTDKTLFNGLTQAETDATASVKGLVSATRAEGSAHTPGPWAAHGVWVYSDCAPAMIAKANYGLGITTFNVARANARLIAAAPELLEALTQCFDFPADVFTLADEEVFTMSVTGRHLRMVRAAIARATGVSQ